MSATAKFTGGVWRHTGDCVLAGYWPEEVVLTTVRFNGSVEEAVANARLMSKAPRMLALLEHAVARLEESTVLSTWAEDARQIIDEAKGEKK